MNHKTIMKQMLDFNKNAFESSFNVMATLQDQTQRAAEMCLEQANCWLPQEGKKAIDEWAKACKKGRETFKNTVDDGFRKAEAFLSDSPKENS